MRRNRAKSQAVLAEKERRGWSDADAVQRERERSAFLDMTDKEQVPSSLVRRRLGLITVQEHFLCVHSLKYRS